MQIAAVAFAVSAIVESKIGSAPAGTVSYLWQIPQIFIITTAEILVSATGLEFAYSQAPASFKGSILALYYLSSEGAFVRVGPGLRPDLIPPPSSQLRAGTSSRPSSTRRSRASSRRSTSSSSTPRS